MSLMGRRRGVRVKKRSKAKGKGRAQRNTRVARTASTKPNAAIVSRHDRGSIAYSADDSRALALLLLPFLIIAMFLGINHTMKPAGGAKDAARNQLWARTPASPLSAAIAQIPLSLPTAAPEALRQSALALVRPVSIELSPIELSTPPPHIALVPAPLPQVTTLSTAIPNAGSMPKSAAEEGAADKVALILPAPPVLPAPPFALPSTVPAVDLPTIGSISEVCLPAPKRVAVGSSIPAADFGAKLAAAAKAQLDDFVVYNASYKRIAYPMGDIPSLYGSCSDVIVRAYRALGIDLQELIQRARVGSGDPNIDHRRTETLRTFFSRHGEIVQISAFAEDYKPGDIVTYYRPFSRVSRAHIAIVSGELGPSGRPMIVHNRGWGPQLEDALFVDRITGHYRFTGAARLLASSTRPGRTAQKVFQRSSLSTSFSRGNTSSSPMRSTRVAATAQ